MKFLAVVLAIVLVVQLVDVRADNMSPNDLREAFEEQSNIGKSWMFLSLFYLNMYYT